jgi:hypothetical protein
MNWRTRGADPAARKTTRRAQAPRRAALQYPNLGSALTKVKADRIAQSMTSSPRAVNEA